MDIVSHDWSTYQLISGSGGIINYDKKPTLDYRQHSSNLIGSNNQNINSASTRIRAS